MTTAEKSDIIRSHQRTTDDTTNTEVITMQDQKTATAKMIHTDKLLI